MEELKKKFLKDLTDYENEKLRRSEKQKTLNYIVVNSQTAEQLKEYINDKWNKI
jgi:dephospho-CoA kinase